MKPLRSVLVVALPALCFGCAARQTARPSPASEPGMMQVAAGEFTMGRDSGPLHERPAHEVRLKGFLIDRTEVTAADFAAFLNAEGNAGERHFTPDARATVVEVPEAGGRSRFEPRPGMGGLPANNVSWHGADAYCRWRGRRLPTEAEWEKAARGSDGRRYPWGRTAPRPDLARYAQAWADQGLGVLSEADSLPDGASAYGLLHMAGNVLEWVQDWYRQNLCDFCNPEQEANLSLLRALSGQAGGAAADPAASPAMTTQDAGRRQAPPRVDPAGPSAGIFKVLRGGSWQESDPDDLSTTSRYWLDPSQRFPTTGMRCAKDPDEDAPQPAPAAQP